MGGRALLVAAVAGVAAVGIASIAWTTASKAARPTATAVTTPAVTDKSDLRALQLQVEALRADVAARDAPHPEGPGAAAAPAPAAAQAEEAPVLSPAEAHALKRQELDTRVESESVDRNWSHATEQKIDSVFRGGVAPGTTVESMKCGSTLCRVKVQHDTETTRKSLSKAIAATEPFDYGVYYFSEPGSKETVLYVLRAGSMEK